MSGVARYERSSGRALAIAAQLAIALVVALGTVELDRRWHEASLADTVTATPPAGELTLRVGERRRFSAVQSGARGDLRWWLDGNLVGTEAEWSLVSTLEQLGAHRVALFQGDRAVAEWRVGVEPGAPPRIVSAVPDVSEFDAEAGVSIQMRLAADAASSDEDVRIVWTLDGAPAGEGGQLEVQPRPGSLLVRAEAIARHGGRASREWRIRASEPPAPEETPAPAHVSPPEAGPRAEPVVAAPPPRRIDRVSTGELPQWVELSGPPPAPPPTLPAIPPLGEIEGLFAEYAEAWGSRDLERLRGLGMRMESDEETGLRRRFERGGSLDVQTRIVGVTPVDEGWVVRFTRVERFRNWMGRSVSQETPTLERQIVRTTSGLRFAR